MGVSPSASMPDAGALDHLYSRIDVRPIHPSPGKHVRRHPGHREGQLGLGSGGRHCQFGNCRLRRPAYCDNGSGRVFPLFRCGAWKLQNHHRRLRIRALDDGERGGRFRRRSTVAVPCTAGGGCVVLGERYAVAARTGHGATEVRGEAASVRHLSRFLRQLCAERGPSDRGTETAAWLENDRRPGFDPWHRRFRGNPAGAGQLS